MADAFDTGRKVLEALERGRRKVLEQRRQRLAVLRRIVEYEARRDDAAGNSEYGRAARIAQRLASSASRRTIYRVYAGLPRLAQSNEKLSAEVKACR